MHEDCPVGRYWYLRTLMAVSSVCIRQDGAPAVQGNSLARPASPTNPVCHPHPRVDVTVTEACMSSS
jgi:hypothetical protein